MLDYLQRPKADSKGEHAEAPHMEPLHVRLAKKKEKNGDKSKKKKLGAATSLSQLPKLQLSNIRENFTKEISKEPLQIYDILAYRSMQPHPLRDDVFRL